MKTIVLIDTRDEIPGQSIGTVIGTYSTIAAMFAGNDAFQARMRAQGEKSHIRTKIATLKAPLGDGEHVRTAHLAQRGSRAGESTSS